jgi:hypothetical protein
MPDLGTFYATASAASFALLGLWWVVIQMRYRSWMGSPGRKRTAYHISLYFLLVAVMSALALVSESPAFWQTAFFVGGALGAIESVVAAVSSEVAPTRMGTTLAWLSVVAYALVAIVALWPTMLDDLGLDISALATEAVLLMMLIVLGTHLAWAWFVAGGVEEG